VSPVSLKVSEPTDVFHESTYERRIRREHFTTVLLIYCYL